MFFSHTHSLRSLPSIKSNASYKTHAISSSLVSISGNDMRSKYVEESNLSSDDDPPSVVLGVGVDALAQLPGERHSSFNNPPLLLLLFESFS